MFGSFRRSRATGPLAQYLATPRPNLAAPVGELNFLALDIETTGLRAGRDHMLSIGWVPVTAGIIELSAAQHFIIRAGVEVGQSATVHGLTDDHLADGTELSEVLPLFLGALAGRVALVHFAHIETSFLSHACRKLYGAPLDMPVVDTFALERRHMERMGTYPRGEDLRLGRVRARYGLPAYRNHNALTDALACAELYLAFVAQSRAKTLRDLMV
ncbi:exonuclease domain-containing protein [Staphylococcus chromogenes]|nr:exonuclease domain-containing protein [Staphylococcus chromogenes]